MNELPIYILLHLCRHLRNCSFSLSNRNWSDETGLGSFKNPYLTFTHGYHNTLYISFVYDRDSVPMMHIDRKRLAGDLRSSHTCYTMESAVAWLEDTHDIYDLTSDTVRFDPNKGFTVIPKEEA